MDGLSQLKTGEPVPSTTFVRQTTGQRSPNAAGTNHPELAGGQVKSNKSPFQLLLGAQTQDGSGASISMFLLALIGLVSGLCAKDAIAQIENTSRRILRRSSQVETNELPDMHGEVGQPCHESLRRTSGRRLRGARS
jgi:hypothetical protein